MLDKIMASAPTTLLPFMSEKWILTTHNTPKYKLKMFRIMVPFSDLNS